MGFIEGLRKGLRGAEGGAERFEIAGHLLTCPHCGGDRFYQGEAQLNTAVVVE